MTLFMHKKLLPALFFSFLGCQAWAQVPNFSQNIAPIVYNKCTNCHRPGEIGPMSFTSYEEVKMYGPMIKYVTENKLMPPWKADTTYKSHANERILTSYEIAAIAQWVDGGMPQGDPALEMEMPTFTNEGKLGTPDLIISMSQVYTHAGDNKDQYQVFVLPTGLSTDRMVKAVEFVPGNRNIVHHAIIGVDTSGQGRIKDLATPEYGYESFGGFGFSPVEEFFHGWTPGEEPHFYPPGTAKKLYKNSDLLVQMHYAPYPIEQNDSSYIYIYFEENPMARQIFTFPIAVSSFAEPFVIEPNVVKTFHGKFPSSYDVSLISILPHMHLLGKSWEIYSKRGADIAEKMIKIPQWDFQWQGTYNFRSLIRIKPGDEINLIGAYDNTAENPNNPNDPPEVVTWGEGTRDEMFVVFFNIIAYQDGDEEMVLGFDKNTPLQHNLTELSAFPNPATDRFSLSFELQKPSDVSVFLHDMQGKKVKDVCKHLPFGAGKNTLLVETEDLKNGTYFYVMKVDGVSKSSKIIINK